MQLQKPWLNWIAGVSAALLCAAPGMARATDDVPNLTFESFEMSRDADGRWQMDMRIANTWSQIPSFYIQWIDTDANEVIAETHVQTNGDRVWPGMGIGGWCHYAPNVRVVIDPFNQVQESNENDNSRDIHGPPGGSRDLKDLHAGRSGDRHGNQHPPRLERHQLIGDLMVYEVWTVPDKPAVNEHFDVYATIANPGAEPVDQTSVLLNYSGYVDDLYSPFGKYTTLFRLDPGQARSLYLGRLYQSGDPGTRIAVRLDPMDMVFEQDERNNRPTFWVDTPGHENGISPRRAEATAQRQAREQEQAAAELGLPLSLLRRLAHKPNIQLIGGSPLPTLLAPPSMRTNGCDCKQPAHRLPRSKARAAIMPNKPPVQEATAPPVKSKARSKKSKRTGKRSRRSSARIRAKNTR